MATKPRAPKAHRFTHAPITLSKATLSELVELAGLELGTAKGRELADDAIEHLSEAANFRDSVERGPTIAGQAVLLKNVEQAAAALERALLDLDHASLMYMPAFLKDEDERPRVDQIAIIRSAAKRERQRCERGRRKGRPTSTESRDMAIENLAWAFHEQASSSINGYYRIALLDFVAAGLRAAGFSVPEGRTKKETTEGREILRSVPEEFQVPRG